VKREQSIGSKIDSRPEATAHVVKHPPKPPGILAGGSVQSQAARLERRHGQLDELARYRIQSRQVEQPKIISVLPVAADALIVIDEITAAVQDQLLAVDLDGSWMMR
jgi:hypothetical protein